jgi:lysophospholipase L1-like esterase
LLGRIRSLAFLRAGLLFLLRTEAEPNPGLFPPRGTVSEVERQLIQFVQRWRSSGARVALCPEAYAYAPPLAQAELENLYVRAVVRAARASGAPLLDVLTPLAQRPHDTLFLDVVHPSLAGHEAIALALARELERHPSLLATGTAGVR